MIKQISMWMAASLFLACSSEIKEKQTPMEMSNEIQLVKPDLKSGLTVNEALANRASCREYASTPLTKEEVSGVMYAAAGVNRENGKLTAPSALALYPIQVYAFFENGVYCYDSATHKLIKVLDGDQRKLTGTQDFVFKAPLNLVYVADYQKYEGKNIPTEHVRFLCGQDAAGYAENVNLYAAAHNLKAITRGSVPAEQLLTALNLDSTRYALVLAQTVGK